HTTVKLPEAVVDPMASEVPVHYQFSEGWQFLAYVEEGPDAIHITELTDPEGAKNTEGEGSEGTEEFSYQPVESIASSQGEMLFQPGGESCLGRRFPPRRLDARTRRVSAHPQQRSHGAGHQRRRKPRRPVDRRHSRQRHPEHER